MENVVLTIHLILALALIGVVLMQRSEGGGLGMGGGGGGGAGGGVMSGRSAATALSKLTWILAVGFLTTSLTLTILATRATQGDSVIERLGVDGQAPAPVSDPLIPNTPAPAPIDLDSPEAPPAEN